MAKVQKAATNAVMQDGRVNGNQTNDESHARSIERRRENDGENHADFELILRDAKNAIPALHSRIACFFPYDDIPIISSASINAKKDGLQALRWHLVCEIHTAGRCGRNPRPLTLAKERETERERERERGSPLPL